MRAKKAVFFVLGAGVVASVVFIGLGMRGTGVYAENVVNEHVFPGKDAHVVTTLQDGSQLLRVSDVFFPDSSPEKVVSDFFRVSREGKKYPVAMQVEGVRFDKRGETFVVQDSSLIELGTKRVLAKGVLGDFAVDERGERFIVSKELEPGFSELLLLGKNGEVLQPIVSGYAQYALPVFSPKGDAIYFISSQSGIVSWYGADASGAKVRQISNVGLQNSDVLGPHFVPVPQSTQGMRFLDNDTLIYDAGDGQWWQINFTTARAQRVEVK